MWVIEKGEILNKLSYRHRLTFSGYKEANGNLYALKIVVLLPIKQKLRMKIAMTKMLSTGLKSVFCSCVKKSNYRFWKELFEGSLTWCTKGLKRVEQADWTHQMSLNCKDRIPLGTDFSKRANQITAPKVTRHTQNSSSSYKITFKTWNLGVV